MSTRQEVYAALESERDYQEMRIVRDGSTSGASGLNSDGENRLHSPEEYLVYMEHYLNLAKQTASTVWGPECKPKVMEIVRKVTALGVAAMEANGAPQRAGFERSVS